MEGSARERIVRRVRTTDDGIPPPPTPEVTRPRVLDLLDEVVRRPLTTLSAPAGFGKTAAAAQWCRQRCGVPVAWLDLDRSDDDPRRLLSRVFEAVGRLTGAILSTDRSWLADDSARLDLDAAHRLSEALSDAPECLIVVDGLRPAGPVELCADIAAAVANAQSCGVHLLALSRCVPPRELISLQLRGAVAHMTADDLRLDVDDTAAVVEAYSGQPIDVETASQLHERLEGWTVLTAIAGLSHPGGAPSADELLHAADDGIDGYLTAEVLNRLPADVVSFLLATSVVDDVTADLGDRLTGGTDSATMLRRLRDHGLPVRQRGRPPTYRYDEPFRTVLEARFRRRDTPAWQAALRTAAGWYDEHERPFDAAASSARLGDWDAVGAVILRHVDHILERDEIGRVAELVSKAPAAVLRQQTEWAIAGAGFLLYDGRVAAANQLLNAFEPHLRPASRMVCDVIRATSVSWVDDMTTPVNAAESALTVADELGDDYRFNDLVDPTSTDHYRVSAHRPAAMGCAFAGWWDRGRAHNVDINAATWATMPHVRKLQFAGHRAVFHALAGEAGQARREAERALWIATEAGLRDNRNAADAYYALGEAWRLTGAVDRAAAPLQRAIELAELNHRHNLIAGITASQLHLHVDRGESVEALALLDRHRMATAHRPPATLAGMIAAAEARALTASGNAVLALEVLEHAPNTSAVASARVLVALAAGERAKARAAIEHWPKERTVSSAVRRGVATAVLQDATGATADAAIRLRPSLATAHRHDLLQPVTEWGISVARVLRRIRRNDASSSVVAMVRRAEAAISTAGATRPRFTAQQAAVITHLARGLSIPAVAREMFLSENTVKTYVRTIYRKLGASTRSEALAAWRSSLSRQADGPVASDG